MNKLFLINCRPQLVETFKQLGCEVEAVRTVERIVDIPAMLAKLEFKPELLLQQELLGSRVFLRGLNDIDCIKMFWSVDTHLNMHWHGIYGALFDGIFTTQKKYVSSLSKESGKPVFWLPWMGARPGPDIGTTSGIVPYTKRIHDLSFVGRVSKERRARQWFIEFLDKFYKLHLADGLTYSQMMELYRQTRIVPNEAIFGEINFRLFEACSCGCAVVTPDVGDGLRDLFEVGREIEVYNDVLELKSILDRFHRDPSYAAALGLAAYERVLREHLPASRAEKILDFACTVSPETIAEDDLTLLELLTEAALFEAGDPAVETGKLLSGLLLSASGEKRDTALLRLLARLGNLEGFIRVAKPYLLNATNNYGCYFNMSASLAALKLDQWDIAKHFWYAYSRLKKSQMVKPADAAHLFMLWGDELSREGLGRRAGVAFDEIKAIPACAADCYFAALYLQPGNLEVYKKLNSVFRGVLGAEGTRLGFLSKLSLHDPENWRMSTEVAITSLKVYRISEGLSELLNARQRAESSGAIRIFSRIIEADLPVYNEILNANRA